jgi:pimeloyl-ACP methyl ester carboxylesterase
MTDDESSGSSPKERALRAGKAVGSAAVSVGRAIGRSVADTYAAIDPDMRRQIAEAPLLGLTLLSPGERSLEPLPDDGKRPIVWVHGLGGHAKNFVLMRTYFRLHGRKRTTSYPLRDGSIEDEARDLGAFILALAERTGQEKIDVVAHSMGGVITRLALEDPAVRAKVGTLVTLGTPHAGTHLARLAATSRTLDLRPGSPVMDRLARQLPWVSPPRLVALYSENDTVILPVEAAQVEGAENVACHGTTHMGFLLEVGVFRKVLDALEHDAPRGPTGA